MKSNEETEFLNYHHLRYFWTVAREGSLRRASEVLRVSQPSMCTQIKLLEANLGEALFRPSGRSLALTEFGQMVFGYAEEIFALGGEILRPGLGAGGGDGGPGGAGAQAERRHRRFIPEADEL